MALLTIGAVLIAALLIAYAVRRAAENAAIVFVFRWLTGHPLDGVRRTDAGWFIRGTKVYTQTGRASRWAHKPRAHRAAWRGGGTLAFLGALIGLVLAPTLTEILAGLALAGLAAFGGWRAYEGVREFGHVRRWVRPLHLALGAALGMPLGASPRSWLTVPRDFATREGAQIAVRLPEGFNNTGDAPKSLIREIVATKLAIESPSASWHLAGKSPHATFTVAVPPPAKVTYADVRQLIDAAKPGAPLAGLGRGRKPVYVDFDQDSPHAIFSMSSGTGKSVVLRTLVAQELHHGAIALILDIKRLSHAWARGLPNVRYCRDIAEIHEALLWLGLETDQRNRIADEGADIDGNTDHVDVGPRLLIVGEELNATSVRLDSYWRRIKDKDEPNRSPAIEAFGDCFFMGRQVKENILGVAQMFTARTVGGPEARENAGTRVLGGYTVNNWRMLVPEIWPMPKKSRVKGRVQVCIAGTAHETQVAFLTPAEARELATSGIVSQFPAEGREGHGGEIPVTAMRLHVARTAAPIGLRQAIADSVIPVPAGSTPDRTLANVRKARQYDPEFPQPQGTPGPGQENVYDPDELAAWARNRPKASAAEAVGE